MQVEKGHMFFMVCNLRVWACWILKKPARLFLQGIDLFAKEKMSKIIETPEEKLIQKSNKWDTSLEISVIVQGVCK